MLKDCSLSPKGGDTSKYVVIFFHGLGSNGELMRDYAGGLLSPMIPDAKIYFPDGPDPVSADPQAQPYRSWFDVSDRMNKGPLTEEDSKVLSKRIEAAVPAVNAYIDQVLKQEGISEDRLVLAGFSQGASMAFYAGLRRDKPVAAVFSLSGGALHLLEKPNAKPPVLLSAGGNEPSHYSGSLQAQRTHTLLEKAGFETECVLIPDKEHEISPESMQVLAQLATIVTSRDPKPAANTNTPPKPQSPPKQNFAP